MPLWILGAILVVWGMGYVVFAFVEPPSLFGSAFLVPPMFATSETMRRVGRVVVGLVLMVAPLAVAYVMLRS